MIQHVVFNTNNEQYFNKTQVIPKPNFTLNRNSSVLPFTSWTIWQPVEIISLKRTNYNIMSYLTKQFFQGQIMHLS